jgi:bacterioferritin-associated ferredoxin
VIVCHCRVVTDRVVAAAVDEGARSLAQVCRSTGAGQDCGACVFSLKRLVCEHGQALVTTSASPFSDNLPEVDVAAS